VQDVLKRNSKFSLQRIRLEIFKDHQSMSKRNDSFYLELFEKFRKKHLNAFSSDSRHFCFRCVQHLLGAAGFMAFGQIFKLLTVRAGFSFAVAVKA